MDSNSNDHINTFLLSISIVGLIGNLVVAFVYWQKKDKQTSTFFILILAFIDLTVCCLLVPMTIYMEYIKYETGNLFLCKIHFFLTTTTVPSSSLLMTAIAFDRYFCICMPNVKIVTYPRAKIITLILLTISASLGVIPALASSIKSISKNPHEHYNMTLDESKNNFNYYDSPNSTETNKTQCHVKIEYQLFGVPILKPFKYFYDFIFLAAVIIITSLYISIYKEIYTRRKAKREHKRKLFFNSYINSGGLMLENDENNQKSCLKRIFCIGRKNLKNGSTKINNVEKEDRQHDPLKNIPLIQITSPSEVNDISEIEAEHKKLQDEKNDSHKCFTNNSQVNEVSTDSKITTMSNNQSTNSRLNYKQSVMRKRSITQVKHVISTKDIRTAFMLFVVSFLFLVFYLPSIVTTYLDLFQINIIPYNLYITFLYFSNSAINPMIYCFLNPTFRADLIKLFFKRGFLFDKCANHVNLK